MLLTTRPTHIIDCLDNPRVNVTVILRCRLTADIRRSRDNRFLKPIAEFFRKRLIGDPDSNTAVLGYQILCQINGSVKYKCGRLPPFSETINELPSHIGHISKVPLHPSVRVYQTDECLRVITLFNGIHPFHCLRIGSVAADTPHGVRRIEDHPTLPHGLDSLPYVFFSCHLPNK